MRCSQVFFILCLTAALVAAEAASAALMISISGNPSTLTINSATAGSQPNNATNSSTTYSITTVASGTTITGKLNANMPAGLTLKVQLQAPTGATSVGAVAMTTTAANLITGIGIIALQTGLTITYTLSATVAAAPVASSSVVLTLTI
jgi:hypothetical protein